MNRPTPRPLVEGVDYYMDGTRFVFTAHYHRKRGYCCNSRCRHCPYSRDHVPAVPIELVGLTRKVGSGQGG
ncbi:MAG: DUF5522 domain-containing protein [Byssovorax sp.]